MRCILVSQNFEHDWPICVDHIIDIWRSAAPTQVHRVGTGPVTIEDPASLTQLLCLGAQPAAETLSRMTQLREVGECYAGDTTALEAHCKAAGVALYQRRSEGFWGQSVAEFALGLTLAALRRIPQTHHNMLTSHADWDYKLRRDPSGRVLRASQFGDDPNFANGTLAGKRVRIVGAGNIGSRYAAFCRMLDADVAAWDPIAPEPCFHRAGARRVERLSDLFANAEIFAPMVPLTPKTERLITAEMIDALPRGTLVVVVTRAAVCDFAAVRRRVLAGELALAADVFDIEPLPLDDPLLGRANVVHTPHNAGRTRDSNLALAQEILGRFTYLP